MPSPLYAFTIVPLRNIFICFQAIHLGDRNGLRSSVLLQTTPIFVIVQNLKCIVRLAAALYVECCFRDKERLRGRQETET